MLAHISLASRCTAVLVGLFTLAACGGGSSSGADSSGTISPTVEVTPSPTPMVTSSPSPSPSPTPTSTPISTPTPSPTPTSTPTADNIPDAFSFVPINDALRNTAYTASIVVSGINIETPISISGGEYAINLGDYTAINGMVSNNDEVTVRLTSSSSFSAPTTATLVVGGESAEFTVTTLQGGTPDMFSFTERLNTVPNSWIESNDITLSGINGEASISVQNGEFSVNDQPFGAAASIVADGDRVKLRHISSRALGETTSTMLTIGASSGEFVSKTTLVYDNSSPIWLKSDMPNRAVIDARALGVQDVLTVDVDGDGKMDVVTSVSFTSAGPDDAIVWYQNIGGSQPVFARRQIPHGTGFITSIYAADLDGDGDTDLLSSGTRNSALTPAVIWYENNGASVPSFTKHLILDNKDGANAVFAADMDNDGDIDVLSATGRDDDIIAWYQNDGADFPTFTRRIITNSADGAAAIYVVDVDRDGDMDVLSASATDNTVAWYQNDGGLVPTFSETVISANEEGARSVYSEDFDGDGDPDVIVGQRVGNRLVWFENDGEDMPSFSRRTLTNKYDSAKIYASDIDGDGDIDVIPRYANGAFPDWYENLGQETVALTEREISGVDERRALYTADMDNDGDTDLVSASNSNYTLAWYKIKQREYLLKEGETLSVVEAASDVDGNQLTYSLSHGPDQSFFSIDAQTGELTLENAPPVAAPEDDNQDNIYKVWISVSDGFAHISRAVSVRIGLSDSDDFDNDGVLDSEDAFPLDPNESVDTDNDGIGNNADSDDDNDGVFDSADLSPLDDRNSVAPRWTDSGNGSRRAVVDSGAMGARDVFAVDVDGDMDIDIVSASFDDDSITWYENDGMAEPSYTKNIVTVAADGAQSVYGADLDGDNDVDLLSASALGDAFVWYENNGEDDPTFTENILSDTADAAYFVRAADIDGDGDMDVLTASLLDDTVAWFENDGANEPSFTERVVTTSLNAVESAYPADMNGDGHVDIVAVGDRLLWFRNNGEQVPQFTQVYVAMAHGLNPIYPADIDSDGDIDIISGAYSDDNLDWYENNGESAPSFTKHVISSDIRSPRAIVGSDVDGDGDTDILSAGEEFVTLFENDGGATSWFNEKAIGFSSNTFYRSIYAVDLDGNGDQEFVSASSSNDTVARHNIIQIYRSVPERAFVTIDNPAIDDDGGELRWGVLNGPDSSFFEMQSDTGKLTFGQAPSILSPQDHNQDNVYETWIYVTDGFSTLTRSVEVTVVRN